MSPDAHELMVTYEVVSPGEFKIGDLPIWYGVQPSPFGYCLIGLAKRGICLLSFLDTDDDQEAARRIQETWPTAHITRDDARIRPYFKKLFGARKGKHPIPVLVQGTNFQIKVWVALLAIPEGKVASYADVARTIGSPRANRAVGTACGKNPIAFIIPCHRVLASGGGLGGYRGGLERKEAMLAWEAVRRA